MYHRYEIGDLVLVNDRFYHQPYDSSWLEGITGIIMDKIESKRIVDPRVPKQTLTSAGYKVLVNGEIQNLVESEIVKKLDLDEIG